MEISKIKRVTVPWTIEEDQFLLEAWRSSLGPTGQASHGFISKVLEAMPHRNRWGIKYRMRCLVRQGLMPRKMARANYVPLNLTDAQYGWLAGLLDGEGSVRQPRPVRHNGVKNGFTVQIVIGYSTDLGIVNRLKELVPQAKIGVRNNVPVLGNAEFLPVYHVVLSGFIPLLDYIDHVLPFMAHGLKIQKLQYMRQFILGRLEKASGT